MNLFNSGVYAWDEVSGVLTVDFSHQFQPDFFNMPDSAHGDALTMSGPGFASAYRLGVAQPFFANFGGATAAATPGGTYQIQASASEDLTGVSVSAVIDVHLNTFTSANQIITGAAGVHNVVFSGAGDDMITGGALDDIFYGGAGADSMSGGLGDDLYHIDYALDQVIEAAGGGNDRIVTSASYVLTGSVEVESLSAADPSGVSKLDLTGNEFNNQLYGNDGVNHLSGMHGNDILGGGAGDDTLEGGEGNDRLEGGEGADSLTGDGGNDVLIGGGGIDVLDGGMDDDRYVIQDLDDVIMESSGGGNDTVETSVSYSLVGLEVENLTAGAAAGSLTLTGNALDNVIIGDNGADTLDGGEGIDTLIGGLDSDTYIVDKAGDIVIESVLDGNDLVRATVSYALAAGQEIETLSSFNAAGTDGLALTGNGIANTLNGDNGTNSLNGGGGIDQMHGFGGSDTYTIDNALDTVFESLGGGALDQVLASVSYVLGAGQEIEVLKTTNAAGTGLINLTGNAINNFIIGNAGNNILDGKGGNDNMSGGLGDDQYYVNTSADVVNESAGGGADTIFAQSGYTIAANVERLLPLNGGNYNANGRNGQDDYISGNAQNNVINGFSGNDTLLGGLGNDTLIGGLGLDTFQFLTAPNTALNRDIITDYNIADDVMQLDNLVYTLLGANGALNAGLFKNLLTAQDANDVILYDQANGNLFYDTNGLTAGGASTLAR